MDDPRKGPDGDPAVDAAEDVFGETSVVLWREFAKFRPAADFAPWALAIAFNQVRKWRHQRERDRLVFSDALIAAVALP